MDAETTIVEYSRTRLINGVTRMQPLRKVEAGLGDALRGVRLFVKRDG
jgi:hypothetical protein